MAENALADQNPTVSAAAAKALGAMGAVSSAPKLKAALNDKEPVVVLAAGHSLFRLGNRQEAYEIDYEMLIGERMAAKGFMESQMDELNSKAAATGRRRARAGCGSRPENRCGFGQSLCG